jgi:hypothetical protein
LKSIRRHKRRAVFEESEMNYQMPTDTEVQVLVKQAHDMRREAVASMVSDAANWLGQLFAPLPQIIKS